MSGPPKKRTSSLWRGFGTRDGTRHTRRLCRQRSLDFVHSAVSENAFRRHFQRSEWSDLTAPPSLFASSGVTNSINYSSPPRHAVPASPPRWWPMQKLALRKAVSRLLGL